MVDEFKDSDLAISSIKKDLDELSKLLPSAQEILDLALEACQEVRDKSDHKEVWCTLAAQVSQSQPQLVKYFLQALEAAKASLPSVVYSATLESISAHLSNPEPETIKQILDTASRLESEPEQLTTLMAISPHLPQSSPELFQQVLETTERFHSESDKLEILKALSANLVPESLQRAFNIAKSMKDEFFKVEALGALAPHFEQAQSELLHSFLASILELEDEFFRAEALGDITTYLPESFLQQVWEEAQSFSSIVELFYSLKSLINRCSILQSPLLDEILANALEAINELPSFPDRLEALSTISKYFSGPQRDQLLQQVLDDVTTLPEEDCIRVLEKIVPQILSSQSQSLNRDLPSILALLPDPPHRAKLFSYILAEAPGSAQVNLQLLEDLLETLTEADKVEFWDISAPYFSSADSQLLQYCLDGIKGLPEERKNETLKIIISHIPKAPQENVEFILREIGNIQSNFARAELFSKVLPHLSEPQENEVVQQSLNLVLRSLVGEERSRLLSKLAPSLSEELLNQSLDLAQSLRSEIERAKTLGALFANKKIPRTDLHSKIIKIGVSTSSEIGRVHILSVSLPGLSDSNRSSSLRRISDKINLLKDEAEQSELVSVLIKQLYGYESETISQALSIILNLKDPSARSRALSSILNQSYREDLLTTIITNDLIIQSLRESDLSLLLNRAFRFSEKNNAKQVLSSCVPLFPDDLERYIPSKELPLALDTIKHSVSGLSEDPGKANFLGTLAPRLSIGLFGKALLLIRDSIQNEQYRTDALCNLAPYIPSEQFEEVILIIKQCISNPSFHSEILDSLSPYLALDDLTGVINFIEERELSQENVAPYTKSLCSVSLSLANYYDNSDLYPGDKSLERIDESTQKVLAVLEKSINFISQDNTDNDARKETTKNIVQILKNIAPLLRLASFERGIDFLKRLKDLSSDILTGSQGENNLSLLSELLRSFEESAKNNPEFTKLIDECSDELSDVEKLIIKTYRQDWLLQPENRECIEKYLHGSPESPDNSLWLKVHVAINSGGKKQDYINALKETRDCKQTRLRIQLLECLIPTLPADLCSDVAEIARTDFDADSELDRGSSQGNLGNEAQEAEQAKQAKQDDLKQLEAKALVSLACRFPQFRDEAIETTRSLANRVHKIQQLSCLAIEKPDLLLDIIENLENIEKSQNSGSVSGPLSKEASKQNSVEKTQFSNVFAPQDSGLKFDEQKEILTCLEKHLPPYINREIKREVDPEKSNLSTFWRRVVNVLKRSYQDALKLGSLRNDEVQDQDLLNLQDEINALTELLLMRDLEPPMTVGILGGWGGGKSYIMHLMQKRMTEMRSSKVEPRISAWKLHPDQRYVSPHVGHIYQIKFDAWTFAKADLWASLMRTIFFELNRQITLEQKLFKFFKDNGIDPDIPNSPYMDIWKVLYQVRDEERDYFLERVLQKSDLENLDPAQREKIDELLWKKRDVVKQAATKELHKQETALQSVNSSLKQRQAELDEAKNQLKKSQEPEVQELVGQVNQILVVSGVLLRKRIGDDAFRVIRQQIEKLLPPDLTAESLRKFSGDLRLLISNILEGIDADGKPYNFSFKVLKQWGRKNLALIVIFCGFAAASVVAPLLIAWKLPNAIVPQLVAFIAPLLPAIGMAQKLWRAGQRWYDQAKQALLECETQIKDSHAVIKRETQRLQKHQEERIRTLQTDIGKLTQQAKELEKQVQEARAAVPENVYASLQDFVNGRIEAGIYDKHLGLIHQVKEDLTNLSYRLLPPPPGSQEYIYKLNDLEAIFPRGPARVVVYIDDLDRCPPDRVVQVLEAVQLLVKTPLFIAVLAIDERYITRALEKFYEGVLSRRGHPSGTDYLEKIIQLPYRVRPIMRDTLESYLRAQVDIQNNAAGGAKFSEVTRQEFNMLLECCQQVDLSPRTLKRLTNIYKLFKIVCRTRGTKPSLKVQKAILALLSLSGRYPELMRGIFDSIEACFEEQRSRKLGQETSSGLYLESYLQDAFRNYRLPPGEAYLERDWEKLRHDALETGIIPPQLTLEDLKYELFNLIRSFSFVGDVGFSSEDYNYLNGVAVNSTSAKESIDALPPITE